ncbi:uncharacterized protein JCM10292_002532 [Rhodotorula paludigena]|uniref:uncharacterized protein n=1 Tax=Rhodotorula paludigena TaxID=86838 RepID=UPI00317F9F47
MAFLRRWQGAPQPSVGAPAPGPAGGPQAGVEWHAETPGERYFGMENFGNICYANSVLQSLYFSKPFRQLVESYHPYGTDPPAPPPLPPSSPPERPAAVPPAAPLPPSPSSSSALSAFSSAGKAAKAVGNALSTPYMPPAVPPTSRRSPPSRQLSTSGPGRGNFFGAHKRQASGAEPPNGQPASPNETGFSGGASLTHQTTNSSFTGVGAPVVGPDGSLVREKTAAETTLLTTLRDLFAGISGQQKTLGTIAPLAFINQLKRENEFFRSTLQQDAHEFLNYLINSVAEILEKDEKKRAAEEGRAPSMVGTGFGAHAQTWVHSLFEGVLTNETRCLTCETVTSRDEAFLDLSIDIEQNTSVTACLRQFSASEMLCQRNKFSCDKCCGLQEAEKRMKIKKTPNILALHLKRFKYEESLQRHVKLTYRVVFPFELRLFNTADDISNPDRLYELFAIVVHIGVGPHHGHYISIVKSGQRWIVFDDQNVYPIEQSDIPRYFGDTPGQGSGYVLFYQAVDLDWSALDLPVPQTPSVSGMAQSRDRVHTADSVSTGGLGASFVDDGAPPAPPLPPASISLSSAETYPAQPSSPPLPHVNAPSPELSGSQELSALGLSLPLLPSGLPAPGGPISPQQRKASVVSLSGSSVGTPDLADKERNGSGSGWSLRGKFGRTKSQASTATRERRASLTPAHAPVGLPQALPSIPSGDNRNPPGDQAAGGPILTSDYAASPTGSATDLSSSMLLNGSTAATPPAPPSEDGSASVGSSAVAQASPFERRRNSRNSFGALDAIRPPLPSSTASSASLSSSVLMQQPPAPPSATPSPIVSSGTSALAKTRGFLTRNKDKPRPGSAHAGSLASANGVGLGLSPADGAFGKSRLSSAPANGTAPAANGHESAQKRPSTASPVVSSPATSFPLDPSRAPDAASKPSPPSATPAVTSTPAWVQPRDQHAGLSKKELEKKIKEEQKAREKAEKERVKAEKERAKQAKEEAKKQEKLRRKLSVR